MRVDFIVESVQRQQHQNYTTVQLSPLQEKEECHRCRPLGRPFEGYFVNIPEGQPVPTLGERFSLVPTSLVVPADPES